VSTSQPDDAARGAASPSEPDGPPAGAISVLRAVDRAIGHVEVAALVFFLVTLIGVASAQAVAHKVFGTSWDWSFEIIRYSVFFIAMTGAALAAHNQRLIAMDVISRLLSPRARAHVRLVLRTFTLGACAFLVYGGYLVQAKIAAEPANYELLSDAHAAWALPVGAALIGLHVALHLVIDVAYLVEGSLPPEDTELAVH
jgi:TRAP-type transport system small permease protein